MPRRVVKFYVLVLDIGSNNKIAVRVVIVVEHNFTRISELKKCGCAPKRVVILPKAESDLFL